MYPESLSTAYLTLLLTTHTWHFKQHVDAKVNA
jgi:hypothetical protein